MTVCDSLHSLLDYECLPFHGDESRMKNSWSHIELTNKLRLFYSFYATRI
jgi:hypothetical protein